jgi:hypothetical protein
MGNRLVALGASVIILAACQAGTPSTAIQPSMPSMRTTTPAECEEAPAWVVQRLEQTLVVPGATLSRIFAISASGLVADDDEIATLASPWWASALINGVGVRPAVGIWLLSALDEGARLRIWAADVDAHRYSNAAWPGRPISGVGLDRVRDCVGPPPEP